MSGPRDLAPIDDPVVPCQVRLWRARTYENLSAEEWFAAGSTLKAAEQLASIDMSNLVSGDAVAVFVHPNERKRVGFFDGIHLKVHFDAKTFESTVMFGGMFYACGLVSDISRSTFDLPDGDYDATASVNWELQIPECVAEGLRANPGRLETWRMLPIEMIREELNVIARARKASSRLEREMALLSKLDNI